MKKIALAGATGYLGTHILKELQKRAMDFKAIARNDKNLKEMGLQDSEIIQAEITKPDTIKGIFEGIDVVISTVGITRQKDGLTYLDVDYQANLNLLMEAQRAGVEKFIYVSAINGDKMRHLKIMEAKEMFVDTLKASELDYAIIRPNGFFSDMKDFLDMAGKGKVYLFGHGNFQLNPIHGADLAYICVDAIGTLNKEVIVGGPDILTQNEIAELALKSLNKPIKIQHLPDWIRRLIMWGLRTFTSSKVYGPYEFFLTMMAQDNIGPRYGVRRLSSFFRETADQINR